MERIFRVDFYPHEWLTGTLDLTPEQRGVYIQIVALIYAKRGPINNDPAWIAKASGCSTRMARSIIGQLIALDKLTTTDDDKLQNWRAENVLKDVRKRSELGAKLGRKSAEIQAQRKKNNKLASAVPLEQASVSTVNTNVFTPPTPQRGMPDVRLNDGRVLTFDQFFEGLWKHYPRIRDIGHKGKAREQLQSKLKEGIEHEIIKRGVARYRNYCQSTGEKNPDFWRWIRDDGFARDYETTKPVAGTAGRAGYSVADANAQALSDRPAGPEGIADRQQRLGIGTDTDDL